MAVGIKPSKSKPDTLNSGVEMQSRIDPLLSNVMEGAMPSADDSTGVVDLGVEATRNQSITVPE